MNLKHVEAVRRGLGDKPVKADDLARLLGMAREEVYGALVWLYDHGLARVVQAGRKGQALGWEAT